MSNNIKVILDNKQEPQLTVALPVYNSKNIAWVSIESLCEQIDIDFNWELIIYEEQHEQSVFPNLLDSYIERLQNIGCTRIIFITNSQKVSLVEKWIEIGKNTSDSSVCFLLHAVDCYSPKSRLKVSYDKIVNEDYDWYDQTKGYFYSFISNRVVLYDYKGFTNLNMSLKTEFIKTLPFSNLKKGIDGYIYNHCIIFCKNNGRTFKRYFDDELYEDSVDTHGHNNISLSRESYFDTKPNIFSVTKLSFNNLGWTDNVKKSISRKLMYELTIIISTYKNTQYLKECFDSITKSIGQKRVQVLVGIDSCLESKEYILNNSFPSNFSFFFFEENKGPYIVFNTLSQIADSKNIMFFGSDDVMDENMVTECVDGLTNFDCVKPYYTNFYDGFPFNSGTKKLVGEGVFAIKKDIFEYMNGFEPWMCAADSDFMARLYGTKKYKFKFTHKINFYRRIHSNGLTSRPDTGFKSQLRASYISEARKRNSIGPLKEMVTEPYSILLSENSELETMTINNPNNVEVQKNVSALDLIFNRSSNISPIKTQVQQSIKNQPKSQIKERPPIDNTKKEVVIEKPIDKNSLTNKAKGITVNKNLQNNNPKVGGMNIGKDSLRI